jgi:hypothetical protein
MQNIEKKIHCECFLTGHPCGYYGANKHLKAISTTGKTTGLVKYIKKK